MVLCCSMRIHLYACLSTRFGQENVRGIVCSVVPVAVTLPVWLLGPGLRLCPRTSRVAALTVSPRGTVFSDGRGGPTDAATRLGVIVLVSNTDTDANGNVAMAAPYLEDGSNPFDAASMATRATSMSIARWSAFGPEHHIAIQEVRDFVDQEVVGALGLTMQEEEAELERENDLVPETFGRRFGL
eukprot:TRINITY_DN69136_c0_g1_i1.p1 TRINITY_DN69136_c0_g1~~TRINITY_DN69136_c0_g1_i1.p1  ORF type:complete len:185 (-),score=24.41 TRINITY_DN69136_c0_g1_i1:183-737(-)